MPDELFPYEGEYICTLDAATQEKALQELNEDPKQRQGAIEALRDWVKKQPHLKSRTDTVYLLRYLRGAYFSQLQARAMIEGSLKAITNAPEWFADLDPTRKPFKKLMEKGYVFPLPKKTPEGRVILVYRSGVVMDSLKEISVDEEIQASILIQYYLYMYEEAIQVNGMVMFLAFTGANIKITTRWSLDKLRKWIETWQGNFPGRYKSIHFYNMNPVLNTLVDFMKTLLSSKLKDRVVVHGSNLEGLYKYVPMECLPEEYLPDEYEGPTAGTTQQCIDAFVNKVYSEEFHSIFMKETDGRYRYEASLKPTAEVPQSSFRKLNID